AKGKILWRQEERVWRGDRRCASPACECLCECSIALFALFNRQRRTATVTVDDRDAEHGTFAQHSLVTLDIRAGRGEQDLKLAPFRGHGHAAQRRASGFA